MEQIYLSVIIPYEINTKARFTLSRLWGPMAKSAGFVSTSANSEGTSVNNVTLPGNILRHRQWRPNVQPTSANCPERTNMFVNVGYVGGESVYRGLSGNIGKRTQVLRDFSRGTSAIFVNVPRFIVFLSATSHTRKTPDRHTTHRGSVESIPWGVGCLPSRIDSLPVCSDLHRV